MQNLAVPLNLHARILCGRVPDEAAESERSRARKGKESDAIANKCAKCSSVMPCASRVRAAMTPTTLWRLHELQRSRMCRGATLSGRAIGCGDPGRVRRPHWLRGLQMPQRLQLASRVHPRPHGLRHPPAPFMGSGYPTPSGDPTAAIPRTTSQHLASDGRARAKR